VGIVQIHQLDCAPVRPYFPPVPSATLCTLVVADEELILIDTGFGTQDLSAPSVKMRLFLALMRTPRDQAVTAVNQIAALGYPPEHVRHIVVTHLHLDHNGGLFDFPHALVHITRTEFEIAMKPRGVRRLFYDRSQWRHGPRWRIHDEVQPGAWFGFDAIEIPEIHSARLLMVPLVGHSPGHAGVAVEAPGGWLFHCGDALPFGGLDSPASDRISPTVCGPHIARLRQLARDHSDEIRIVSSHVPPRDC
jgi:glyoxylase-like metal-dependent hydrolase (beta-lactamase superfamily II)